MRRLIQLLRGKAARSVWREANGHAMGDVPTLEGLRPLFQRELRRARRYERPLTVMVLRVAARSDAAQRSAALARLGVLLQAQLRETDLLARVDGRDEIVALIPEAGWSAAQSGLERMRRIWSAETATRLLAGIATYPDDGLTLEDLIVYARDSSTGVGGQTRRTG